MSRVLVEISGHPVDLSGMPSCRRPLLLASLALLAIPATASADHGKGGSQPCPDRPTSQALLAFGDAADYFLAPGGDFGTGGSDWRLKHGADVTAGAPASPLGDDGTGALELPVGSAAVSPAFCVDSTVPQFRFFYSGGAGARVVVDVLTANDSFDDQDPVRLRATGDWSLSPELPLPDGDGSGLVRLRFRATGGDSAGPVLVDDVLVDPRHIG